MSTFAQLRYHVVFSTKGRMKTLDSLWRKDLFDYLGATINHQGGHIHAIDGTSDHVHLLFSLRANHALSDVVRELKKSATAWIREEKNIGKFKWQEGYGAFTVSPSSLEQVRSYILNQEKHHQIKSFSEEFKEMLDVAGVKYDPKYLP